MWAGYRRANFTFFFFFLPLHQRAVLIGAESDYNNHFHFLLLPPTPFFHESVGINSAALYKIRIPQGDGVPIYLYTIRIVSELHGHVEFLVLLEH